MKYILSLILGIIAILSLAIPPASAHIAGQPPFFLMNEKYADYYPVYSTSLTDFTLPQDLAPETYLVNEPIDFVIDTKMLPFPPVVIEQITYTWDFGDGTTGEGTENSHSYTTPGSYLLTINADYGEYSDPNTKPVIQAVLLHVLPNRSYQLPQPVMTLNKTPITDPLIDTLSFNAGESIDFAVKENAGSAPITEYFWDKGDGTRTTEESFTYSYDKEDPAYLFPFVRVTDENGFIVDTYAQIENVTDQPTSNSSWFQKNALPLLIGVNAIILLGGGYFLLKKK